MRINLIRVALIGLFITGIVAAWAAFGEKEKAPNNENSQGFPSKGDKKFGGKQQVVSVTAVMTSDVRVYQNALGSVTSFASVAIKARVTGQLDRVVFHEGQSVTAGQLLAQIDDRPFRMQLAQAEGQQQRDQALLANSQADLERYHVLKDQDSIATQQVDSQRALVEQYKGTLLADKAAVDNARLQLSFTRIVSPISGRVGLRQIDTGNNISTSDTLTVVNQISPIAVTFTVPEEKVNEVSQRFQSKQNNGLRVEAWDKGNRKLVAVGKLQSLDNQIDASTGTIKLKASFDNLDGVLFPNQFVNVRLLLETLKQVPVLPFATIQHGRQGDFVFVADSDNTVRVRQVRTGAVDEEVVAILDGVKIGEKVVTSGFDKLRDGMKVTIAEQDKEGPNNRWKRNKGEGSPEKGTPYPKHDRQHHARAEIQYMEFLPFQRPSVT